MPSDLQRCELFITGEISRTMRDYVGPEGPYTLLNCCFVDVIGDLKKG